MNDFPITPHRAKILSVLLAEGDIHDSDGQSTTLLMDHTGHRISNALSGVLLAMEQAGLIERDKAGRRTYRIGLTRQGRKLAQSLLNGHAPAPVEADEEAGGELLDVLKDALAAISRHEARIASLEAELAELRATPAARGAAGSITRTELAELKRMVPTTAK